MARRLAAALLLLTLLLSGCWSRVELNDVAIISEVGLDWLQNGQVRLAAGIVIPGRVTTPGGQGGTRPNAEAPVAVITETGRDIMEALIRLQYRMPRRLYWGHMQVIVIGEELARHGMGPYLDFWTRHRRPRLSAYVVAVHGEALDFLAAKPLLRRLPADAIREILRSPIGLEVTLVEVLKELAGGLQDPVLPAFGVGTAQIRGAETTGEYVLTGAALFKGDRLAGWLDQAELPNLLFLLSHVRNGTISVDLGDAGLVSLDIYRGQSELEPRLENGRIQVRLRTETEGDLTENVGRADLASPDAIVLAQRLIARKLNEQLQATFYRLVAEFGVDPAGVALQLRRANPAAWKRIRREWRERLADARITVDSAVYIRRSGRHGPPMHQPKADLRQP